MALSDATKEKIRLRATFVNNLGVGVILVGVLTPVTRAVYDTGIPANGVVFVGASVLICFVTGLALHLMATRHLRKLDQ